MKANFRRVPGGPVSPLAGVTDLAWQRFVAVLEVQMIGDVSASGGLGSFDMRPRRLVELEYATGLRSVRTDEGRQVQACDLIRSQRRFLADTIAQYAAFQRSCVLYSQAMQRGDIKKPDDVSLSGALCILQVGGKGALAGWPKLFENTRARYEAAKDLF